MSVEAVAGQTLFKLGILQNLENLMMSCKASEKNEYDILQRIFNLLSKVLRNTDAANACAK